jgi:putative transposase
VQFPQATYHVTARAVARRALFRQDDDRSIFATLFERVVDRRGWICHSGCLLTTHYHLLIRTLDADLAAGMQWLNSAFARTFNLRYGESGHVFEARYSSELILTDEHFLAAIRYIALNPVRAGLCDCPEEWVWSSYGASFNRSAPWPFPLSDQLLAHFGTTRSSALAAVRRFVEDGLDEPSSRAA